MRIEKILGVALISAALTAAPARAQDEEPSDARLEAVLVTVLQLNPHLNVYGIEASVTDARAELRGTVETEVEKILADDIVLGVTGIQGLENRIVVRPDAARNVDLPPLAQTVKDANVEARVRAQLLWNDHTRGAGIDVDAGYGRVTLHGTAPSAEAAQWAERIAHSTRGVNEVINDLKIEPDKEAGTGTSAPVTDSWITARVKRTLHFNQTLDDSAIDIATVNGVVALEGTVASEHQRRVALALARNVHGVEAVEADLRLRETMAF